MTTSNDIKELIPDCDAESSVEEDEWLNVAGGSIDSKKSYRLVMAGGGAHWWHYVYKNHRLYTESTRGVQRVNSNNQLVINKSRSMTDCDWSGVVTSDELNRLYIREQSKNTPLEEGVIVFNPW